jgi:hypothetical protein
MSGEMADDAGGENDAPRSGVCGDKEVMPLVAVPEISGPVCRQPPQCVRLAAELLTRKTKRGAAWRVRPSAHASG